MCGIMRFSILVLFAFAGIDAKAYWKEFVPENKEVVYEYNALVKAGTHIPHPFASDFLLKGKLRLQLGSDNELLVRLDDLKYALDNGRTSERRTFTMQTSDLESLGKPFKIVYEDNGTLKKVIIDGNDPEYALNMKKSIATTLQMNWEKIPLDAPLPFAFSSKEPSIYGVGDTLYNVFPRGDKLKITRMHYTHSTANLYKNMATDFTVTDCEAAYEEPLSYDSQKKYIIDKKVPLQYVLRYMETNGGVYIQPSQAKSSAFYVHVNQTFQMLEIIDKIVPMTVKNEVEYTSLQYLIHEHSMPAEKLTGDSKNLIPIIYDMLTDMLEFMKENKVEPTEPDMAKGQYINRVLKLLSHLDASTLDELYTKLSEKTGERDLAILKIFQQIIPLVGTTSSLKYIIKAVQKNKFNETISQEMLQKMSFYIRIPTEQTIREMDSMLKMEKASWSVRKTAVLSYATLLHKLNDFNLRQGIPTTDIFKKYIELFINKIETSEKLEEQYLYFDALFNMHNDLVIQYLEEVLKEKWFNGSTIINDHIRYKAMTSISSVLLKHKHHDKMFELLWPIMTDTTLPTYMRIMAFYFIMKSKPSLTCQINIYSFMQHEKDVDFLNFYYTYLKSLAESNNPCLYKSKLEAKQLLLYWPLSYVHSNTQFQKFDMTNWKYNYGGTVDFGFIRTKNTLILMLKADINVMNFQMNPATFYIKIDSKNAPMMDELQLLTKKGMKRLDFGPILQSPDFEIEVIDLSKGQIVDSQYYAIDNMNSLISFLSNLNDRFSTAQLDIDFDVMTKLFVPTDIGLPVFYELLMPTIHEIDSNSSYNRVDDDITNFSVDNKHKLMSYYSYGLSFYNPFASVWQGIAKYMHVEGQLPIYFDLSLNRKENSLKLLWKRHQEKKENVIGYRSYAATYVYVRDYLRSKILQKISPTARNYVRVSHKDNYKHNVTLLNVEDYNIGYKRTIQIFDDENPKYYQKFPTLYDFLFSMEPSKLSEKIMKFFMQSEYIHLQHDVQERGIMFKMEPSEVNPVTAIELKMKFIQDVTDEAYALYQPATKFNVKVSYSIKKEDNTVKTWDMNSIWNLNNQHTVNSIKADITRHVTGQSDYKICIEGMEQYSNSDITGHMTITMGQSADGKCNKDETSVQFTLKGEQLPEQKQGINNYDICHRPMQSLIDEMRPYSCYMHRSSLRNYTLDIKTQNFPTEFKKMVRNFWTEFLAQYYDYYRHFDDNSDVVDNNLRIQLRYPISKDIVDMRIITPTETHKFAGVPAKYLSTFGVYPDNLYYSNIMHTMHSLGLTNICIIDRADLITTKGDLLKSVISNEWTQILHDPSDANKRSIWTKLTDNKLAMKMVLESKALEIVPTGETYTITMDGKEMGERKNLYLDNLMITKMEDSNTLVMVSRLTGSHVIYNGHQILYEFLKTDLKLVGKCISDTPKTD